MKSAPVTALESETAFAEYLLGLWNKALAAAETDDHHAHVMQSSVQALYYAEFVLPAERFESLNIPMLDAIRLAGKDLGHFHVGEANRRCPYPGGRMDWPAIGKALKEIGYDGYVVMEPFVQMGGQVGKDISIWRDMSHGATVAQLDADAAASVKYLRETFEGA